MNCCEVANHLMAIEEALKRQKTKIAHDESVLGRVREDVRKTVENSLRLAKRRACELKRVRILLRKALEAFESQFGEAVIQGTWPAWLDKSGCIIRPWHRKRGKYGVQHQHQ